MYFTIIKPVLVMHVFWWCQSGCCWQSQHWWRLFLQERSISCWDS